MILIDNRNYLKVHHRSLLYRLRNLDNGKKSGRIFVEQSKMGAPTLKVVENEDRQYMHSKYDPVAEAETLIKKIEGLENYNHILFIGTGLGYHINSLLKKNPDISFSIYEPDIEMLYEFFSYQNLTVFPKARLKKVITTRNINELRKEIIELQETDSTRIYVYALPFYKNRYEEEIAIILDSLKDFLKNKRSNMFTNVSYQKRWTINSIKNFPKVLETPNILHDIDKEIFKGKSAIIVAAGPSLNEEIENLKIIKEQGRAYIFSVGSAINSLINHGVYPDAACTYDPSEKNQVVFKNLKEQEITEIPLIFGSSVGFETIHRYPGQLLHMLTNQDTIAPFLIKNPENIKIVMDAPSIAVVTFQLLVKLGFERIILVGQNLAFQNNIRYASGINYNFIKNEITEEEKKHFITIKDVDGNDVNTNEVFNQMRLELETHIRLSSNIEVINTTKGGANIEGSRYVPLSQLINEKLIEKNVVIKNWFLAKNSYDSKFALMRMKEMESKKQLLISSITDGINELKGIKKDVEFKKSKELNKKFNNFDKEFIKIRKNLYFIAFIEPMVRVHNKRLSEESQSIRHETDLLKKGYAVANMFTGFLMNCLDHIGEIDGLVKELSIKLERL